MLIIGSSALQAQGIDLGRTIADTDIICSKADLDALIAHAGDALILANKTSDKSYALHISGQRPIDVEVALPGSAAEALLAMTAAGAFLAGESRRVGPFEAAIAAPDLIYTLKMSHRYLRNNPHFRKTRADILRLRDMGCAIPDALRPWYSQRVKDTYWYKHPNLNQGSKSFFADDNVPYVFDHDSIHEAIKTLDKPAFEYIKLDAAEVFCSKEKFLEAPEHVRLATVLEESYVLALERHQIPNGFKPDPRISFLIALEKVCTSIASGWWREYAWENYDAVRALYNPDYVARFEAARAAGRLRPYNESSSETVEAA